MCVRGVELCGCERRYASVRDAESSVWHDPSYRMDIVGGEVHTLCHQCPQNPTDVYGGVA